MLRSLALLTTLALAACGHMPISTMIALRSFDFATFDPGELRAAVSLPEALAPKPGGVRLQVTATLGDAPPRVETFVLQPMTSPDELAPLAAYAHSGQNLFAYRVALDDLAKVRALQDQGRKAKAESPGRNSLRIAITADACRTAALAAGPILSTIYLRPDPATGYVTFLRDVDLREGAEKIGKDFEASTLPCDEASPEARP